MKSRHVHCCALSKGLTRTMAKILCVLYDDPVSGYPKQYPRDGLPELGGYPDGQTLPTPSAVDFTPGELLGSVSGELGLRSYLEGLGHELVVTSDKEGEGSEFDKHLADAEVVDLPAVLARLPDRGADRERPESEDRGDRRYRVRPRRPGRGHRQRRHGGGGDVLQQHQRRRARGDDDPLPGAELPAVVPDRAGRRLEHRRLRPALLRPRGDGRRHRRGWADRVGGAAPARARSTYGCTTPTSTGCPRRSSRS